MRKWIRTVIKDKKFIENHFWRVYTIAFIIMALIVFFPFYHNGKTLIWSADGWTQHFKAMVYYGRWLRHIVRGILQTHTLHIPKYSFSLGYGADVITTLHYYVIGDPLTLLAVFVPSKYTHHLYDILIILRFYLAGASFAKLCIYMKKEKNAGLLAGTFVYVFCAFALIGMRHPYFLNPMIYFPLLLLGIERILKEKKPGIFTGAVFVSVVSNFYFFYMLVLLTVLYVSMRLIVLYKNSAGGGRAVLYQLFSIGWYAVIGVMLGAFMLLPVVLAFFDSPRTGVEYAYSLFASVSFLERFPSGFLSYTDPGGWSCMGFSAISLVCVFLLYLKKRHLDLKIAFAVLTGFLLFPVFGHIFNGFSYTTNRWIWGYSLLVAYIVVTMWPDLFTISRKEGSILLLLSGFYFFLCMVLRQSVTTNMGFAIALVFVIWNVLFLYQWNNRKCRYAAEGMLCAVTVAGIIGNVYFGYSMFENGYVGEFKDQKELYENLNDTVDRAVLSIGDTGDTGNFFRYSGSCIDEGNTTLISGLSGVSYYWSLSDREMFEYMVAMGAAENTTFDYHRLDGRAVLNTLAGVKYFVTLADEDKSVAPYGFEEMDLTEEEIAARYRVYRNDVTMPLGYTYRSYITPEMFEELTPLQRQEALLQGIYLEKESDICEKTDVILTGKELDYVLDCDSMEVSQQGDDFVVTQPGASVTLSFEGVENAETYLYMEGIEYSGTKLSDLYNDDITIDPYGLYTQERWEELPVYVRNQEKFNDRYWKEPSCASFSVKALNIEEKKTRNYITYCTPEHTWPTGRHDFLVNLGYDDFAKQSITITFPEIGIYHFDGLQVLCQPMDHYIEQISELRKDVLQQIDMHDRQIPDGLSATNTVTGTITVDVPKILCLTIPYSTGWEAYVDGERQEVLKANIMFCALELEPGAHEICLRYHTPGLRAGMILSGAGLLLLIVTCLYRRIRRTEDAKA